tara:strand:+ start:42 stop:407 length:366 start_codon:yes stop_codon:yes gene_type:complete
MITQLGLIFIVILSYELLRYSKFIYLLKINISIYKKIFKLLTSKKVSDTKKEKGILNYSKILFLNSVKIIIILLIILFLIVILRFLDASFISYISDVVGIFKMILLFLIYSYIRKKIHAKL